MTLLLTFSQVLPNFVFLYHFTWKYSPSVLISWHITYSFIAVVGYPFPLFFVGFLSFVQYLANFPEFCPQTYFVFTWYTLLWPLSLFADDFQIFISRP